MHGRRGVHRIISGGQAGADQGALRAARELGLATGGAAAQGWLTEEGPQEAWLRSFGLEECSEEGYPARTRANVLAADGTLIVGAHHRGGTALTVKIAQDHDRPLFFVTRAAAMDADLADDHVTAFREWIGRHQVGVLNVAGSRESENPGIGEATRRFLLAALRLI